MKMDIPITLKAGGAGVVAVAAWITSTFGEAFYALAVLLILDMILNYANEKEFIQKMGNYMIGTAAAFYVQNMSMTGIQIAHGLVIVLALNELTQVGGTIRIKLAAYKTLHPGEAPAIDATTLLVNQVTAKVLAGINAGASTPANVQTIIPPVPPMAGVKKEGVNGE